MRPLPKQLLPISTRESKELYDNMMSEYNKMKKIYETDLSENVVIIEENISENIEFEDNYEKAFEFIEKSKEKFYKLKNENKSFNNLIEEYEKIKTKITKIENLIKEGNEIYKEIALQTNGLPFNSLLQDKDILVLDNKLKDFSNELNNKIEDMHGKVKDNATKLSNFKDLIMRCMGDDKIERNICNVCVTNKIDTCINPCGHTFCAVCVDKMKSKCGMCRGEIKNKIKMYIESNDNDNTTTTSDIPGIQVEINNITPATVPQPISAGFQFPGFQIPEGYFENIFE